MPAQVLIAEQAIATMTIPGFVDFLATDGRDVWATNTDRVEKLSVASGAPVAAVPVPSPCGGMVCAFGALWVASCKDMAVYRVDLSSRTVSARIQTGLADPTGELSLAAGAESIWVLSSDSGVLARIDPRTNDIVARIEVMPHSYCADFGFGAVWISNSGMPGDMEPGSVQRIDPKTNRVTATVATGPGPRFLAAGEGAVWTLNWGDGSVSKIDPVTNRLEASFPMGMAGGGDIATGAGKVWVRGTAVLLASIDPITSQVIHVYGPPQGSGAVRVADDLIWVTAHDTKTVWVLRSDNSAA